MTSRLYLSKIRGGAIVLLTVAGGALGYIGVRNLAALDPFARYTAGYANPFGGDIGSIMSDVGVSVYDGPNLSVSFDAAQIDVRRDRQFMRLKRISNGRAYNKGRAKAAFTAGTAGYDVRRDRVDVAGGATLSTPDMRVSAEWLSIDGARKEIRVDHGVRGRYKGGDVRARTLKLRFGSGESVATGIEWSGPLGLQGEKKKRTIRLRGKWYESFRNPDREVWLDAEAVDQDSLTRAGRITLDKEKDIVTAEGACEYHGLKAVMYAPKVVVYRREKRAVANGDVRMFIKAKKDEGVPSPSLELPPAMPELPPGLKQPSDAPDPLKKRQREIDEELRSAKTARKYPTVITCSHVEYFYAKGSKRAIITGSPKARQELPGGAWREVTAPKAIYEEEKELLTLLSENGGRDVHLTNSSGDDFTAETLVISTVEGNETMRATRIEGVMKVDEEELEKEEKPQEGKKPPPKGGGGG